MLTLVVVPERDQQRCLTIPDLDNQVFAHGQWIQIKRGLYQGDVGLVVDDYRYDDSTTGVKVLVVPQLEFSNEDGPPTSSSSKRKRLPSRPSPQLFNPSRCIQDQLFCREKHVYSYKSWRFEYGLQLKTYNKLTLSPAREIPAAICHLFMESKERVANENALIEMSSMPVPSFWRFETGDHIIVYSPTGAKLGTIVSLPENYNTLLPQCEVDVEEEGSQLVSIRDLQKNIILGEFIEVLAGVHAGKKGFVVAKTDALLGICAGSRTNGLDFRVHVNSVKLTTPDFSNTEVPWVDVEVVIQSGQFVGCSGFIKNVRVDFRGALLISFWVARYQCSIEIDHSAVREKQ
ncbi:hypothetical protein F5050DRAFT_1700995 [Lentinula boryana]|uniref:KOW domain-containing protein n=1 Tax=Lentinula boryana TaxID=40481 RepID=A0ABQ8PX47_9AGAR|nr:hypothetical protein F5050DRAFT_1700995 [Lentinula boryana]